MIGLETATAGCECWQGGIFLLPLTLQDPDIEKKLSKNYFDLSDIVLGGL